MKHMLALAMLWFFGIWAVLSAAALGVLLHRALREIYWQWRFNRAVNRSYSKDVEPLIRLVRESEKEHIK